MSEYELHKSGLVIPQERPKQPQRRLGLLEVKDPDDREKVAAVLSDLWDALKLTEWSQFRREEHEAWYRMYRYMGESLLGDDCPEKEQWT